MTPEQFAELKGILERHTAAMEQIADGIRFLIGAVISAEDGQSGDGQTDERSDRTMDDLPLIGK